MVAGLYGLDGEKLENWAQSIIAKIQANREANERAKQEQNKPKPQANNISDLGIRAGNYNFFKTVREQKAREDIVMYMISMIVDALNVWESWSHYNVTDNDLFGNRRYFTTTVSGETGVLETS